MQQFKDLSLSAPVLKALESLGFETPTEIQQLIIPKLIGKRADCIGLAQTGTGKTAAFSLPLLENIETDSRRVQALILAPTRELAKQIDNEISNFSKFTPDIDSCVVYGGANISTQIKEIKAKRPQIIIATPGRLIDLINRKVVKLQDLSYLILDEADEMLNMGFQEDIDYILEHIPEERSIWLFSATMPADIRKIVNNYMTDPIEVKAEKNISTSGDLEHKYVLINRKDKLEGLKRFIDASPDMYTIVFCRTRMDTQEVAEKLSNAGYPADAIHGDLSQSQRESVLKKFRSKVIKIMVATDVAARGIDVNDITHVIQYSIPDTAEYYTHRSGRTARAGRKGVSITFATPREKKKFLGLLRKKSFELEEIRVPSHREVLQQRMETWARKFSDADVTHINQEVYQSLMEWLGPLNKEDIIKRIVALQFGGSKKGSNRDLNASAEKGRNSKKNSREKDRRGRRGKGKKSVEMFINIGKMDQMGPGEIKKFIVQNGSINKSDIGDIRIQKMNTVFELEPQALRILKKNFKNVSHRGRSIRCNPH